ncbi:MAG: beta-N-acetylhexosaminidase [Gammaproteobacteria bacterium]
MLDLDGLVLSGEESELLLRPEVGGIILFARNFRAPGQLRDLVASIREVAPHCLLAVDQEGGRVQRFQQGFLRLPSLQQLGECCERERDLSLAQDCGWAMAAEILHHGLDFSFAPVLDVFSPESAVIGNRSFAANPDQVIDLARAYIGGMHEAGMAATGKHFPGHGSVSADSHHQLPIDRRSWEQIKKLDLRPFAACVDLLDAIMPAHVLYPEIDERPAGFSQVWIQQKLRGELGFDGVVFSDDLSMTAAHCAGDIGGRVEQALAAGCDMVLVCNDRGAAVDAAQWLQRNGIASNDRLAAMRRRDEQIVPSLYDSSRWQRVSAAIGAMPG